MKYDRIDKKFQKLGFTKTKEWNGGVAYEKYNDEYKYIQIIELQYKYSGKHLIHSYSLEDEMSGYYNVSVGMSRKEAKLSIKKINKMLPIWERQSDQSYNDNVIEQASACSFKKVCILQKKVVKRLDFIKFLIYNSYRKLKRGSPTGQR